MATQFTVEQHLVGPHSWTNETDSYVGSLYATEQIKLTYVRSLYTVEQITLSYVGSFYTAEQVMDIYVSS